MAKEKTQEKSGSTMRQLSENEIKDLSMMIKRAGGVTEFLIKEKALRVGEDGELKVQLYEGLGNSLTEAYAGVYFETDIPLNTWNQLIAQVEDYWKKRKYAEQHGKKNEKADS